jgi:hypothetical protein
MFRVIVAAIIIALGGIAVAAAAVSLLLVQSASATDVTTTTVGGEGETTSAITAINNNSNVTLGNLFYDAQGIEANENPINDTYIVISYVDNVTLMPPNATGVVINATETGNFTLNIQPNGLSVEQGQGFLMTEDGAEEENATATFVSLSRTDPEGTVSGTGVVFFSTNSTGQLAFLNNMIGIAQIEVSQEGSTVKIWEWKGGTLPFENGGGAATPLLLLLLQYYQWYH